MVVHLLLDEICTKGSSLLFCHMFADHAYNSQCEAKPDRACPESLRITNPRFPSVSPLPPFLHWLVLSSPPPWRPPCVSCSGHWPSGETASSAAASVGVVPRAFLHLPHGPHFPPPPAVLARRDSDCGYWLTPTSMLPRSSSQCDLRVWVPLRASLQCQGVAG
jgi:hypothetical protein